MQNKNSVKYEINEKKIVFNRKCKVKLRIVKIKQKKQFFNN